MRFFPTISILAASSTVSSVMVSSNEFVQIWFSSSELNMLDPSFLVLLLERELCLRLSLRSRSRRLSGLDRGLRIVLRHFAFYETNRYNAEENDDRNERPGSLLQEVRRLGSTHHLVSARKTGSQTTAFTILNQHQQRQQNSR